MSTFTKAAWYEQDALPEPEIYDPGSTPCPCCGYSRNSWSTEAYMDGNAQGEKWAVCQITDCPRCQYEPKQWDGTEADWLKQADEYRKGWLEELSDEFLTKCESFFENVELSSGKRYAVTDGEKVDAAINWLYEEVTERLYDLCCKLDTLEGCKEVANEPA